MENRLVETCKTCGLIKELCVCKEISKEKERIRVYTESKRFKKLSTIVEGFDKGSDVRGIAKELKQKFACGGTVKDQRLELQGDHRHKIKEALMQMNYSEDQIEVV